MESAAGLPWNQRQLSPGIGGRLAMESVAAFVWNGWQLCRGISGRIHLESVAALPWNTQKRVSGALPGLGDAFDVLGAGLRSVYTLRPAPKI